MSWRLAGAAGGVGYNRYPVERTLLFSGNEASAHGAVGAVNVARPARCAAASWRRGLAAAVPGGILDVNQRAFALGRGAVSSEEVGP